VSAIASFEGVSKKYGRAPALRPTTLDLHRGVVGLLGPNGAGKTTTLRMVTGLLKPDRGSIEVFGVDVLAQPRAAKELIAWLPDEPLLYDKLTVMEYLEFVAGLWRMDPARAAGNAQVLLE
jgi:ABC-2 type transport system ATP-binding protein